ncbi:MAG: hypothetical protein IJV31_03085 [Clostridia bacterium]|nr:hypothetical protein [Clostridia bacterium]
MNLVLDDKPKREAFRRKILIISILVVCLIAILIGAYAQVFRTAPKTYKELTEQQYEELSTKFESIFTNTLYNPENKTASKIENDKDLVYTGYNYADTVSGRYTLAVNIPYININNDIAKKYNEDIKSIFEAKAQSILNATNNVNTIYSVGYVAYVNENILSLVIHSNLKDGTNAQRTIIQTYNFDLQTQKSVSIDKILETKGITKNYAESKVRERIKEEERRSNELKELGYVFFQRDYTNDIYEINNTTEYFIGENGYIYLVYAYGNEQNTSELDVIIF